ncbi:uncharacterized protein TNCV_716131 [Trichonephila clavipes]|nr:uncharacterized protein TNCV_716131 [Trichonephila clavipes]
MTFVSTLLKAGGSLVVKASDSQPDGLGSMPVPPNTLQVHAEYVFVKTVGQKVLWAESRVQADWKIFPSPSGPCLNCGGGDRWCRHLSSLRELRRANLYYHVYGAKNQQQAYI